MAETRRRRHRHRHASARGLVPTLVGCGLAADFGLAAGCVMPSAWLKESGSGSLNAERPAHRFCPAAARAAAPCCGSYCCRAAACLHRGLWIENEICASPYPCRKRQETK